MPRKPRQSTPEIPMHVIQRGNNKQQVFLDEQDKRVYLNYLKLGMVEHKVSIHAWVLMSNHVHILCTPHIDNAVSKMMQTFGSKYSTYFNKKHQRSGTLWEGRFRSGQILDDSYLLCTYRYIELNPLRAGMVSHPAHYSWSSYRCNALGVRDDLVSPHNLYLAMGKTPKQRQNAYQSLFLDDLSQHQIETIHKQLKS